ncbi:MAG: hypothetical protein NVS4B6_06070 [Mycobacterium sp.]
MAASGVRCVASSGTTERSAIAKRIADCPDNQPIQTAKPQHAGSFPDDGGAPKLN